MSKTRSTTVTFVEYKDPEFKAPSKYSFINAMGDVVFIHCLSREKAQEWINENYGKGKYKVRVL